MSGQNKSGGGLLKNPVTMINSSFGLLGLSGGEKTSSSFDSTKANASGISVSSPVVDVNQMLTDTFAPPALQSVQPKGKLLKMRFYNVSVCFKILSFDGVTHCSKLVL